MTHVDKKNAKKTPKNPTKYICEYYEYIKLSKTIFNKHLFTRNIK